MRPIVIAGLVALLAASPAAAAPSAAERDACAYAVERSINGRYDGSSVGFFDGQFGFDRGGEIIARETGPGTMEVRLADGSPAVRIERSDRGYVRKFAPVWGERTERVIETLACTPPNAQGAGSFRQRMTMEFVGVAKPIEVEFRMTTTGKTGQLALIAPGEGSELGRVMSITHIKKVADAPK